MTQTCLFPTGTCSGVWYSMELPTGLSADLSVDAVTGVVRGSYVAHTIDNIISFVTSAAMSVSHKFLVTGSISHPPPFILSMLIQTTQPVNVYDKRLEVVTCE